MCTGIPLPLPCLVVARVAGVAFDLASVLAYRPFLKCSSEVVAEVLAEGPPGWVLALQPDGALRHVARPLARRLPLLLRGLQHHADYAHQQEDRQQREQRQGDTDAPLPARTMQGLLFLPFVRLTCLHTVTDGAKPWNPCPDAILLICQFHSPLGGGGPW